MRNYIQKRIIPNLADLIALRPMLHDHALAGQAFLVRVPHRIRINNGRDANPCHGRDEGGG